MGLLETWKTAAPWWEIDGTNRRGNRASGLERAGYLLFAKGVGMLYFNQLTGHRNPGIEIKNAGESEEKIERLDK